MIPWALPSSVPLSLNLPSAFKQLGGPQSSLGAMARAVKVPVNTRVPQPLLPWE